MTVVRRGAQTRARRSTTSTATRRQRAGRQQQQHARRRARAADMGAPRALTTEYGGAPPATRSSRLGRTTSTDLSPLAARTSGGAAAEVKRHGAAWPRTPTRAAARRWMPRSTRSAARAVPRNPAAHGAPPKIRLSRRDSGARRAPTRSSKLAAKRRCSGGSQTAWRGLAAHANSSSGAAVDAALNALSGTGGAAQPGGARSAAQD